MKILMINVTCGTGSTGRICTDLADALEKKGHIVKIAYGRDEVLEKNLKYAIRIGTNFDIYTHVMRARLLDGMGFGSINATKKFIEWVKIYDPDVIHLHNIHGYYINIKILFEYLKTSGKKIIWTLHDSWAFTGHTPYCDVINCHKWKICCDRCELLKEYPKALIDFSKKNWIKKNAVFNGISEMTIITPSEWLQSLLKKSFLKKYNTLVINNGINTKTFFHRNSKIFEKYGIKDKFIILGVASVWDKMKGLNDYLELSKMLDESCKLVLVGLTTKQIKNLPRNILGIERTESTDELAMLYSEANLFLNLSYCENYPTVNIEALACGTPVITYNTGGSPEIIFKYGGAVVEKKNILAVKQEIKNAMKSKIKISFSSAENDISYMISKYLKVYENI